MTETPSPPIEVPPPLAEALRGARRVVASTGAGVSAESGVPTFRDALTGLWARYDPMELGTPEAFARDPALVWSWFAWRRDIVRRAEPNPGHHALARLEDVVPSFTLVTQNVDGLHARAGSRNIVELHGNILRVRCSRCGHVPHAWDEAATAPPPCEVCGALLRPDVVWFGEQLPERAIEDAVLAAQESDVFLTVGTSSVVFPAAILPEIARSSGAVVVEINPIETPLSPSATHVLRYPSGVALPALVDAIRPRA